MIKMRRVTSVGALIVLFAVYGSAATRKRVASAAPTFNEVSPIFQRSCTGCHHPGGLGPFSLTTYKEARPQAFLISLVTRSRQMPPWKPSAGCGDFIGENRLTEDEIRLIRTWADKGAPEGDPSAAPPLQEFSSEWLLGEPDMVLDTVEPYLPPAGVDSFRGFVLPQVMPRDRYVRAVDVRPGARQIVHHVSVVIDLGGEALLLDAADPQPGFDWFEGGFGLPVSFLGNWVPNAMPFELPRGTAIRIPAGAQVVLQVHYHPHMVQAFADRIQIGLYFANDIVDKLADNAQFFVDQIDLPAGAKDVVVNTAKVVPVDMEIYAAMGHMHYLGRSISVNARLPDGTNRCLLDIADWDIHWQGSYRYREPVRLLAGTIIEVTGRYDNSTANPRNPSYPPRDVHQGYLATDEMCGVELTWAPAHQQLSISP